MRLLYPAGRQSTTLTNVYDDGIGCGLDNGSPDAYAECRVEVDAGAAEVLAWFTGQFLALGWSAEALIPTSGVAYMRFRRDADERLGVLLQRLGDWAAHPERA